MAWVESKPSPDRLVNLSSLLVVNVNQYTSAVAVSQILTVSMDVPVERTHDREACLFWSLQKTVTTYIES